MKAIVQITGGLGNQLFQCAHAFALKQSGRYQRVFIDTGWYSRRHRKVTHRSLGLPQDIPGVEVIRLPDILWSSKIGLARLFASQSGDARRRWIPVEMHRGYWQSVRTAWAARREMERLIAGTCLFIPRPIGSAREYVAVHIRLGDYVANPQAASVHGGTDFMHQIELGFETANRLGVSEIRVCTDDPRRVASALHGQKNIKMSKSVGAWETLVELSSGVGLVMSNSSLSWWAATLMTWSGINRRNLLIPVPWLRSPGPLDEDLCAYGWQKYDRQILV